MAGEWRRIWQAKMLGRLTPHPPRGPKPLRLDDSGNAAIEFALVGGLLVYVMLNVVDIARYAYTRMQVENAAQMGVQSIWKFCDPVKHLPASTQCPNFNTAITRAVQSTNLGNQVTLQTGSPAEGYYCVNNSNALELVEKVPEPKPADCASIGRPSLKPGLYLRVDVRYTYAPLFPNLTAASLFDTQLSQTSYMRLL